MEMVAAAKLTRARSDVESARPYGDAMNSMLGQLARASGAVTHPLFEQRDSGPHILVVFSSDRGLCGAYNSNVTRQARRFIEDHRDEGVRLVFVGRKSWDYFRRRDFDIVRLYRDIGTGIDGELARQVTDDLVDLFLSEEVRTVQLLFTRFVSTVTRSTVVEKLLNIEPPVTADERSPDDTQLDYIFEPSPERIFKELLPRYALTRVVSAFLEAFASEHSSRMVAMSSATTNAEEMIDSLVLYRNRLRQAIITREIAELVGGAEALA
jgi:F-type H+-transporting ATPase subunit gamma